MARRDAYAVLGASREADPNAIEVCYVGAKQRLAVLEADPDLSPQQAQGLTRAMTSLEDAFTTLHDPARRRMYDEGRALVADRVVSAPEVTSDDLTSGIVARRSQANTQLDPSDARTRPVRPHPRRRGVTAPARPDALTGGSVDDQTHEHALLRAVIGDRPGAWRPFLAYFDPFIVRAIARATVHAGWITSDDRDEIRAQFLLELTENSGRKLIAYDPTRGTVPAAWVGFLAFRSARNWLRRNQRSASNEELPSDSILPGPQPTPDRVTTARLRLSRFQEFKKQLPPRQARFVELWLEEGRSTDEIAEAMGISADSVYTERYELRRKLQRFDKDAPKSRRKPRR